MTEGYDVGAEQVHAARRREVMIRRLDAAAASRGRWSRWVRTLLRWFNSYR